MQIPRDLSRRMLEAVDQVPIIDVYERLVPERNRVSQRVDFIAWLLAFAGTEIRALGFRPDELEILGDIEATPDDRWAVVSRVWPYLKTTGTGRMILRIAWELFGAENIDERTWKDISARLWQETKSGFYQELLCGRANIRHVLVDNAVDPGTKACCVRIVGCDRLLSINCRSELAAWAHKFGMSDSLTLESLDLLIEQFVRQGINDGCVGFKLGGLPDIAVPSDEQVAWAFGRMSRCQDPSAPLESGLQSFIMHRLLYCISLSQRPLQIHVDGDTEIARLSALANQYPDTRFLGVWVGKGDAFSLGTLGRTLPNVALALVGVWRFAPVVTRQVLRNWVHGVPLKKVFALGGNMALVEAVCIQALVVREQIAVLLAEMVAAGELDEDDALLTMDRLLYKNAQEYFGLK